MSGQRQFCKSISILAIAVGLIGQTSASFAGEPSGEIIDLLLRDGEAALADQRFTEAYERFSEVLALDWNHPRAYDLLQQTRIEREHALLSWEGQARDAESRRDLSRAKYVYERILAEDSTRTDIRDRVSRLGRQRDAADFVRSGMEKFMLDDYAAAQLEFEQAMAINPNDTLAAQYSERARQKLAASGSLSAVQSDPESWTRYLDGLRKFRDGDLTGAEHVWSLLLVKYPGNEGILSNLEQVRRRLGTGSPIATDQ